MHKSGAASWRRPTSTALQCIGSCSAPGRHGLLRAPHLQLGPLILDECSLELLLETELVIAALIGGDGSLGKGLQMPMAC